MPPDKLILLVEDDFLIAMALEADLQEAGYKVVTALSSGDALHKFEAKSAEFAALITDIRLPDASGWDIAIRVRKLAPGLPVIYMSGDSTKDWPERGVEGSIMLTKPFLFAVLHDALRKLARELE